MSTIYLNKIVQGDVHMFIGANKNDLPRYERQIWNVDELVLNTIRKEKNVQISKSQMYDILEVLYDYRVID